MSNVQAKVFEAFRSINVSEDKALKEATALSQCDDDTVDIKHDLTVLKWMVGTLYPLVIAILLRLFLYFGP